MGIALLAICTEIRAEDAAAPAESAGTAVVQVDPGSVNTGHDPNRVVARINGESIYFHEVEKRVDNFEKKFQEVNPAMKLPEEKRIKMRQDFLDRMVREKIMEQAARKGNFSVSDAEIDERINQLQKILAKEKRLGPGF